MNHIIRQTVGYVLLLIVALFAGADEPTDSVLLIATPITILSICLLLWEDLPRRRRVSESNRSDVV